MSASTSSDKVVQHWITLLHSSDWHEQSISQLKTEFGSYLDVKSWCVKVADEECKRCMELQQLPIAYKDELVIKSCSASPLILSVYQKAIKNWPAVLVSRHLLAIIQNDDASHLTNESDLLSHLQNQLLLHLTRMKLIYCHIFSYLLERMEQASQDDRYSFLVALVQLYSPLNKINLFWQVAVQYEQCQVWLLWTCLPVMIQLFQWPLRSLQQFLLPHQKESYFPHVLLALSLLEEEGVTSQESIVFTAPWQDWLHWMKAGHLLDFQPLLKALSHISDEWQSLVYFQIHTPFMERFCPTSSRLLRQSASALEDRYLFFLDYLSLLSRHVPSVLEQITTMTTSPLSLMTLRVLSDVHSMESLQRLYHGMKIFVQTRESAQALFQYWTHVLPASLSWSVMIRPLEQYLTSTSHFTLSGSTTTTGKIRQSEVQLLVSMIRLVAEMNRYDPSLFQSSSLLALLSRLVSAAMPVSLKQAALLALIPYPACHSWFHQELAPACLSDCLLQHDYSFLLMRHVLTEKEWLQLWDESWSIRVLFQCLANPRFTFISFDKQLKVIQMVLNRFISGIKQVSLEEKPILISCMILAFHQWSRCDPLECLSFEKGYLFQLLGECITILYDCLAILERAYLVALMNACVCVMKKMIQGVFCLNGKHWTELSSLLGHVWYQEKMRFVSLDYEETRRESVCLDSACQDLFPVFYEAPFWQSLWMLPVARESCWPLVESLSVSVMTAAQWNDFAPFLLSHYQQTPRPHDWTRWHRFVAEMSLPPHDMIEDTHWIQLKTLYFQWRVERSVKESDIDWLMTASPKKVLPWIATYLLTLQPYLNTFQRESLLTRFMGWCEETDSISVRMAQCLVLPFQSLRQWLRLWLKCDSLEARECFYATLLNQDSLLTSPIVWQHVSCLYQDAMLGSTLAWMILVKLKCPMDWENVPVVLCPLIYGQLYLQSESENDKTMLKNLCEKRFQDLKKVENMLPLLTLLKNKESMSLSYDTLNEFLRACYFFSNKQVSVPLEKLRTPFLACCYLLSHPLSPTERREWMKKFIGKGEWQEKLVERLKME